MQLPKPVFPIKYDLEKLKEEIQGKLEEEEWGDIPIHFALELTPVYFFHYEFFSESVSKETNQKKVEKSQTKKGAINANTGILEPELIGYPEKFNSIQPEEFQVTGLNVSFKKINLQEPEIKGIANLKIAGLEGTAKENIVITGIELLFVPIWIAKIELDGHGISISANAIEGRIVGLDKIPEREKNVNELFFETLDDLQSPLGWVSYSVHLLKNRYVLVGIAILIIVWFFFFNQSFQLPA